MPANLQTKKWTDVHIAITALAVTATLGMWNMFSAPSKPQAALPPADTTTPQPPDPTETSEPTATAQPAPTILAFRPVKIIYGGLNPQLQVTQVTAAPVVVAVAAAPAPAKKQKKGGGGSSSSSSSAGTSSAPAASTGSSKP